MAEEITKFKVTTKENTRVMPVKSNVGAVLMGSNPYPAEIWGVYIEGDPVNNSPRVGTDISSYLGEATELSQPWHSIMDGGTNLQYAEETGCYIIFADSDESLEMPIGVGGQYTYNWYYAGGTGINFEPAWGGANKRVYMVGMHKTEEGVTYRAYWFVITTNGVIEDVSNKWAGDYTVVDEGGGGGGGGGEGGTGLPSLPAFNSFKTGLVQMYLYKPTSVDIAKLDQLGNFIWGTGDNALAKIVKSLDNPFDALISMNYIPVQNAPYSSSAVNVIIGDLNTGYTAHYATDQFYELNMGNISIPELYNSYLDYAPYTKVQLFLPYIGTVEIATDDVMGKSMNIVYHGDVITGQLTAFILVNSEVRYQFTGNCSVTTPLTGRYFANYLSGVVQGASSAVSMGLGAGVGSEGKSIGGNVGGIISGSLATQQVGYERSGNVTTQSGLLGSQGAYAIVTRPNKKAVSNYGKFSGHPYVDSKVLNTLSGFTVVDNIHLEGVRATQVERDEIVQLLKEGVVI